MNLFLSLFLLSALVFTATPSAAQSSDSGTRTTSTLPRSGSSSSSTTSSSTSSTPFGNITTTNSQGSTFVTSIPITIPLSTTPSTTSSAPFPSLTGYPSCGPSLVFPLPILQADSFFLPTSTRSHRLSHFRGRTGELHQYHRRQLLLPFSVCPCTLFSTTCKKN